MPQARGRLREYDKSQCQPHRYPSRPTTTSPRFPQIHSEGLLQYSSRLYLSTTACHKPAEIPMPRGDHVALCPSPQQHLAVFLRQHAALCSSKPLPFSTWSIKPPREREGNDQNTRSRTAAENKKNAVGMCGIDILLTGSIPGIKD